MKTKGVDVISQNKVFGWIAAGTLFVLAIPFLAMQFTSEVDWKLPDFVIIGMLLFGAVSLFVLTARKVKKTSHRIILGIVFLLAVLYVWAELAVGIFTNLGS